MRWKTILRLGIIIYTFFMMSIECKTNIMAIHGKKVDLDWVETCNKKNYTIHNEKALSDLPFYDNIDKTIKVFSGDFDKAKLVCTEYILTEVLNETDEELLTRLLKMPLQGEENGIVGIPNESYIKSIELNLEESRALINMTQAYELTNYGSLGEYLALQSIISTVKDYYNVQTAVISVDGKPYCSGHFCFEEHKDSDSVREKNVFGSINYSYNFVRR